MIQAKLKEAEEKKEEEEKEKNGEVGTKTEDGKEVDEKGDSESAE